VRGGGGKGLSVPRLPGADAPGGVRAVGLLGLLFVHAAVHPTGPDRGQFRLQSGRIQISLPQLNPLL